MAETLIEPYNGAQSQDAQLEFKVAGTGAGDCNIRMTVTDTKYWDMRLNNDNNDELLFQWGGNTVASLGTDGIGSFAGYVHQGAKGTGTFTAVLGSLSPASTLQPTWLPMTYGTISGYFPFYAA